MSLKDNYERRIKQFIKTSYKKIQCTAGEIRFNYRCHLNAVHEATKKGHKEIALVIQIESNGWPIIHFVNYDGKKYIDNTWGYWTKHCDYYLIRKVSKIEFDEVSNILYDTQQHFKNKATFFEKLFHNVNM
jgi:hypothetical protein